MHKLFSDGNIVTKAKLQPSYAYSRHWRMSCQLHWWHC